MIIENRKFVNKRLLRINSLIRDELSNILLREVEFPESVLATITRVEVSDDLFNVNVYISVIPDNKRERVFEILNKLVYFIQQKLNKRLRVRPIPKIFFKKEKLTAGAARVEELLEEAKKSD
ncbi:MAG: Ribosome-binding factor A [Parcubacteria group bacterium GW2011_GWC2_42_13]|nr:MAG: Ribosome-binding factor A [Parcubacteria group bacterium GW2011_GWC2_42_13]